MAEKAVRWLPREQAKRNVDALWPSHEYDKSLFRSLIAEGVFADDLFYSGQEETPEQVIRFSYERFADHRVAKLMLDTHLDSKHPERAFKPNKPLGALFKDNHTAWRNLGLIEALSIQVPERVQRELPDLLPRSSAGSHIRIAFVESLIWRTRTGFSDSTLSYINTEVLRYRDSDERFWNAVLTLAPVPGHRFNAASLHKHLSKFTMSDRDAWWSTFIHRQYGAQSAIDRLLDWVCSPVRTKEIEGESALLCATAIAWLLTSSNRFLRDSATKALVKLIGTRVELLLSLLKTFRSVNDAYVLERIFAVAYGCAMKAVDKRQLQELAEFVYEWIFAAGKPYTHILVRDYASSLWCKSGYLKEKMV